MTTLRAKLAALIALVIISMVIILTSVFFYLFRPPDEREAISPLADQVQLLERVSRVAPDLLSIRRQAAAGEVSIGLTAWLRHALEARGTPCDVVITQKTTSDAVMMSIPIQQGWIVTEITDLPPRAGVFNLLLMWMAFIASGAMIIALFFANRVVQPLVLLERAIESVGDDALLPELAVEGPSEVRVTAQALNSLSARLRAAMESRMRLVAAAGHDLRTPITRMRLRAEFVENDDDRAMWLKDIHELGQIADSAILLVREESSRTVADVLRLDIMVAAITEELRELSYDVTLTHVADVMVRANQTSLKRALQNLIINAATHGKRARVAVERRLDRAVVVIDDDGPGIPADLMGQVFEPFFRADPSRAKDTSGAGLGLTIAREVVQRAGGRISIENGFLHGLLQTVSLPALEKVPQSARVNADVI